MLAHRAMTEKVQKTSPKVPYGFSEETTENRGTKDNNFILSTGAFLSYTLVLGKNGENTKKNLICG